MTTRKKVVNQTKPVQVNANLARVTGFLPGWWRVGRRRAIIRDRA